MRDFLFLFVLTLKIFIGCDCIASADDDLRPVPDPIGHKAGIHLPVVPVLIEPDVIDDDQPAPLPPPNPGPPDPVPVTTLSSDQWYVIESDVPLIVLHSPAGIVAVEADTGPLKIRGIFSDGTGQTEMRTYQSKHLYFVNAVKTGTIELLIVPVGVSAESDIVRQLLTVTVGPRPPPVPPGPEPIPPGPGPEPIPTPPTGLRVLLLYNEDANREQLNTINSTEITAWMNANCATSTDGRPEWRRWDRTSVSKPGMLAKETPVWQKLWADASPTLPAGNLLVVATDTKVTVMPLVGPDATLDALKKIKEGK